MTDSDINIGSLDMGRPPKTGPLCLLPVAAVLAPIITEFHKELSKNLTISIEAQDAMVALVVREVVETFNELLCFGTDDLAAKVFHMMRMEPVVTRAEDHDERPAWELLISCGHKRSIPILLIPLPSIKSEAVVHGDPGETLRTLRLLMPIGVSRAVREMVETTGYREMMSALFPRPQQEKADD